MQQKMQYRAICNTELGQKWELNPTSKQLPHRLLRKQEVKVIVKLLPCCPPTCLPISPQSFGQTFFSSAVKYFTACPASSANLLFRLLDANVES